MATYQYVSVCYIVLSSEQKNESVPLTAAI